MTERIRAYVAGAPVDDARSWFPAVDPATGAVTGEVAESAPALVDRAVEAARGAVLGPWGRATAPERAAFLRRAADAVERRFDAFVEAEVLDTGKPLALARSLDVPRAAANLRAFADLIATDQDACFHQPTADGGEALHYTRKGPIGVIGVICPWNLPLLLATWKVAPALAAGNAVVLKPSEETPRTATLLAGCFAEAGLPPGAFNVVHGFGPDSAGDALVRHPDVGLITFTGETRTGQAIMAAASARVKRLSFELGGKNPAIVLADADLERAVAGIARAAFLNTGQVCLCAERIYVARSIYEPFVEGLAQAARAERCGDPRAAATTLGPLISAAHREKVLSYYALAKAEGAHVHAGGGVPEVPDTHAGGFFVEPTLLTGLPESSRVNREEVFGPVCHVRPFDDVDEAVALANDSDYGLCASVWTRSIEDGHRVAHRLESGMVWVNTWFLRELRAPFGGVKLSGVGREGGRWSLDAYRETKSICVKL